jgi:7,8-didemethyl-8-hydroxy-5-deazariboflavin synthase CofH subunit
LFSGVSPEVARVLDGALCGRELSRDDALLLMRAEGADFQALTRAADVARAEDVGDDVSFVINRNINFTNVCYTGCSFCGFSRRRGAEDAFDHSLEEIAGKAREAVARGATEVCIQGGIDPGKDHHHYREILLRLKREFPALHIHAYSPEEIDFGHRKSGMSLGEYLTWLRDAGLGTIPGTAAEILDDAIRTRVAPRRLMTRRWVEIVRTAHSVGLRSSATIMYGHVESIHHVVDHLRLLRDLQKETGGFTEFVALGFIHEKTALGRRQGTRPGPSATDDLRMIAVARLFFRPWITNIQMSWVKLGGKLSQLALLAGANDFGGTLMEESISRESGANHGENLPPEEIRRLIREVGRIPVQRSTEYEILRRFEDPALDPPSLEPRPARVADGDRGQERPVRRLSIREASSST